MLKKIVQMKYMRKKSSYKMQHQRISTTLSDELLKIGNEILTSNSILQVRDIACSHMIHSPGDNMDKAFPNLSIITWM